MKQRTCGSITLKHKSLQQMWDFAGKEAESLNAIGRVFDRPSSSIFGVLSPSGGIRPADRKRSRLALSLQEREEISRGLVTHLSLRTIASQLGRAPSTITREVNGLMVGCHTIGPTLAHFSRPVIERILC